MFWHNPASRALAGVRCALLAGALGLLFLAGSATPASAGTDSFCSNTWVAANQVCNGPSRTLTAVRGTNWTAGAGCAGALYVGEYFCATPAGCHTYAGNTILVPSVRHRSTTGKQMSGYSTWTPTGAPTDCNPGTRYALVGPVTTADPVGVPVLEERERERAPQAVSEIWPNADATAGRRFDTPRGDGWVLPIPADRKICVAVPDPDDGYGYSCQNYADARTRGALVTLEDDNVKSAKGDLVVALPAEGAEGVEVTRRDGSVRTVEAVDGVVAVELGASDTTIALEAADDAELTAQRWSVGRRR